MNECEKLFSLERDEGEARWADRKARWPDFYIVGAPKAGTTSLFKYLSQHPKVVFSHFKETHYFGSDLIWRTRAVPRDIALDSYMSAANDKLLGDASVFYLASTEAAKEIHEANPAARIIAVVRNPLSMIPSLYSQAIRTGDENQSTLAKAMALEPRRKAGEIDISPDNPGVMQQLYYSEIARYSEQLRRYFDVFGRDRVLVVEFDAFVRDPLATVSDVFTFLGLTDVAIETKRHNEARTPRNWVLYRLFKHPFSPLRKLWRGILPGALRRRILMGAENIVFKRAKAQETAEDLRRIAYLYSDDVAKLEELTGLDLSLWRRNFDLALEAPVHHSRRG
jgi:hypothetical protein